MSDLCAGTWNVEYAASEGSNQSGNRGDDQHGGAVGLDHLGFFAYLRMRGDITTNSVAHGPPTGDLIRQQTTATAPSDSA